MFDLSTLIGSFVSCTCLCFSCACFYFRKDWINSGSLFHCKRARRPKTVLKRFHRNFLERTTTGPEICVAVLKRQSPSRSHSLKHPLCVCKKVEKAKMMAAGSPAATQ
jgi:hypothetical protein